MSPNQAMFSNGISFSHRVVDKKSIKRELQRHL